MERRAYPCADGTHGDQVLLAAALSGDQDAFGELAQRHWRSAYEIAQGIARNAQDASELVQESLLRAWRALDRFIPDKPFAPWFYRIVRNTSIQFYRSRRRHPVMSLNAETDDAQAILQLADPRARHPEEALLQRESDQRLASVLARIPERDRALIVLAHYEGFSYKEIAERLAIPISSVRSRLKAVRARIHCLLAAAPDRAWLDGERSIA